MPRLDDNGVSRKELSVQCVHASEDVNTVDKVTDVNSDRRYDPDLDTVSDANDVHGHSVKKLVFKLIGRIATLMNLIFMIVPKQMMEMLSRQIQFLMVMLNKMMYPKILFKAYKTKL